MKSLANSAVAFVAIAMIGGLLAASMNSAEAGPRKIGGIGTLSGTDLGSGR